MSHPKVDVAIVGAGILGLAHAYWRRKLVDPWSSWRRVRVRPALPCVTLA